MTGFCHKYYLQYLVYGVVMFTVLNGVEIGSLTCHVHFKVWAARLYINLNVQIRMRKTKITSNASEISSSYTIHDQSKETPGAALSRGRGSFTHRSMEFSSRL